LIVTTIDGNVIKSIEENGNSQHKRILAWLEQSDDNKIEAKAYSVDELILHINKKVKLTILAKYSRSKQINIDRACLYLKAIQGLDPTRIKAPEKLLLEAHKAMDEYITSVISIGMGLKENIAKLSPSKLQKFDIYAVKHWKGIE
jgi:hypothetical protein